MKFLRSVLIFFLAGLSLHADDRSAEELFFEANVRAGEEAYADAIPLYEAAIAKRPSASLHYNLGNAYYQLGDWGRARLHLEKALAMEPQHRLAQSHLQMLLRERQISEAAPGFWFRTARLFSYSQWVWIGTLCLWLTLFSLLARKWKRNGWPLAIPAALGAAGLLLACGALLLLNPTRNDAIVLDEETSLRIAPAPGSPVAAAVRPAQRVRVVEQYGDFFRVLLENGQEGYLQAGQLEKVW